MLLPCCCCIHSDTHREDFGLMIYIYFPDFLLVPRPSFTLSLHPAANILLSKLVYTFTPNDIIEILKQGHCKGESIIQNTNVIH